MFIRFVSAEIHGDSQVAAGIFVAPYRLRCQSSLPDYECDLLSEVLGWFNEHLPRPDRFSRSTRPSRANKGIYWFRSSAREHIGKAREMIALLENNDVFIRMLKAEKIGYVVYEDEFQVVAEPFGDMRLLG